MAAGLNYEQFASAYVANGGNGTKAAIEAGYSPTSARQAAYKLTNNPTVQRLIREEQHRVIGGRLASKALQVLEQVMLDESAPAGARVDCAKTLLDRAGLPAIPANMIGQVGAGEKPLNNMSIEELSEFISSARQKLLANS